MSLAMLLARIFVLVVCEIGGRTTPDCASDSGHRAANRFDSQQTFTRAFKKQFAQTLHFTAVLLNGAPLVFARRCVG